MSFSHFLVGRWYVCTHLHGLRQLVYVKLMLQVYIEYALVRKHQEFKKQVQKLSLDLFIHVGQQYASKGTRTLFLVFPTTKTQSRV